MTSYDLGRLIGHITGYALIAVIVVFILYKLMKKK